jgi:ABC-type Zn uptake system ZnuABC Zn-binding protein ZnuA
LRISAPRFTASLAAAAASRGSAIPHVACDYDGIHPYKRRDIAEFQNQVKNKQIKVLVYNVQTVTPITEQLKQMARDANIPIVGVSETMPVGAQTFQGWQASQLRLLLNALHKASAQ